MKGSRLGRFRGGVDGVAFSAAWDGGRTEGEDVAGWTVMGGTARLVEVALSGADEMLVTVSVLRGCWMSCLSGFAPGVERRGIGETLLSLSSIRPSPEEFEPDFICEALRLTDLRCWLELGPGFSVRFEPFLSGRPWSVAKTAFDLALGDVKISSFRRTASLCLTDKAPFVSSTCSSSSLSEVRVLA